MGSVILICGKLCSGKSYYARRIAKERTAVILSCDELMYDLFRREEGAEHDKYVQRVQQYLLRKATEIVTLQDVVLDWGFWTKQTRADTAEYFSSLGIPFEWHYVPVDNSTWETRIAHRNNRVLSGETTDYYVDDGLMEKFRTIFEEPNEMTMDVIVSS